MPEQGFPNNPAVNDTTILNGMTYKFNGSAWDKVAGAVSTEIPFATQVDLDAAVAVSTTQTGDIAGLTTAMGTKAEADMTNVGTLPASVVAQLKGDIGNTGAAGSNGSDGATGSTGSTGSTGAAGSNGSNGSDGATGSTGSQGPIGNTGAAGSNGSTGSQGATGPQGPGWSTQGGPSSTVTLSSGQIWSTPGAGWYAIDSNANVWDRQAGYRNINGILSGAAVSYVGYFPNGTANPCIAAINSNYGMFRYVKLS